MNLPSSFLNFSFLDLYRVARLWCCPLDGDDDLEVSGEDVCRGHLPQRGLRGDLSQQ